MENNINAPSNKEELALYAPPTKEEIALYATPTKEEIDLYAPPTKEEIALYAPDRLEKGQIPSNESALSEKGLAGLKAGVEQGATLGYADELAALAGTAGYRSGLPEGQQDPLSLLDRYAQIRDEKRAETAKAAKEAPTLFNIPIVNHPVTTYTAGELGGGIIPAATTGGSTSSLAALGAVQGLGSSEADLTNGDVSDAALDTAKGAGMGLATAGGIGALKLAGKGVGRLASSFKGLEGPQLASKASELGKLPGRIDTAEGQKLAASDLIGSAEKLGGELKEQASSYPKKFQQSIETAEATNQKFDLSQDLNTLVSKAEEVKKATNRPDIKDEMDKLIQTAQDNLTSTKPSQIREARQLVQSDIQNGAFSTPKARDLANQLKDLFATSENQIQGISQLKSESHTLLSALEDLGVKDVKFNSDGVPELSHENIKSLVNQIRGFSGNDLSSAETLGKFSDLADKLQTINPTISAFIKNELPIAAEKYKLSQVMKGEGSINKGLLETTGRSIGTRGAYLLRQAEQAAKEEFPTAAKIGSGVYNEAVKPLTSSLGDLLSSSSKNKLTPALITEQLSKASPKEHEASKLDNASPNESLKLSQQLKAKFGDNPISNTLEQAANQDQRSRNALMFTIMQNPKYRQMINEAQGK